MIYIFLPLGIILLFLSASLLYKAWNIQKEGFQSSAEDVLENVYRPLVNIICPALLKTREKLKEDPDNGNVDEYIYDKAGGDVIYCPALKKDQLFMMNPSIGEQMIRTVDFLEKKMSDVLDDINESLTKSCEESKDREGQQSKQSRSIFEGFATEEKVDTKGVDTKGVDPVLLQQLKDTIYGQRISSIYSAMGANSDFPSKLNRVQYLYIQLTDIESNPEKLRGSC